MNLHKLTCVPVESIRGCCVRWCPGGRMSRWAPRGLNVTGLVGCHPVDPVGSHPTFQVDFRPSVQKGLRPGVRGSCLPLGLWSHCSWGQGSPAKARRSLPEQPAEKQEGGILEHYDSWWETTYTGAEVRWGRITCIKKRHVKDRG